MHAASIKECCNCLAGNITYCLSSIRIVIFILIFEKSIHIIYIASVSKKCTNILIECVLSKLIHNNCIDIEITCNLVIV